jgi:hypothetical protein
MSWHTNVLVTQVDLPEKSYRPFVEGLDAGSPSFREKLLFNEAIDWMSDEGDGIAIASVDGWTSVWGEFLFLSDKELGKLSKVGDCYFAMLDSRSDTFLFEWWSKGVRVRKRAFQQGAVFMDMGKPLPQEMEAFKETKDEEERIFLLMEKLSIPFKRLTKPKFHMFETTE